MPDSNLFFFFQGTPLLRTPIRKRQFNTPVTNIDMTPCRSTTRGHQVIRTTSHLTLENSEVLANTRISLTKEFEATSLPENLSHSVGGQCERPKTVTPGVTISVPKSQNMATPLRVPSNRNNCFESSAMFQNQNSVNGQSKSAPRKPTPHPKVCWTETSVELKSPSPKHTEISFHGNTTPMRVSCDLNVSGIQALGETPAEKDQQMAERQVMSSMCDPFSPKM